MRRIWVALLVAFCLGCPSKRAADQPQNAKTQRSQDSAIGESNFPGAGGVRGALRVSDSAAARQALIDSAGGGP